MRERKIADQVPREGWREWLWFGLATLYGVSVFVILFAIILSGMPGTFLTVGIVVHLVLTAIMRRL